MSSRKTLCNAQHIKGVYQTCACRSSILLTEINKAKELKNFNFMHSKHAHSGDNIGIIKLTKKKEKKRRKIMVCKKVVEASQMTRSAMHKALEQCADSQTDFFVVLIKKNVENVIYSLFKLAKK